MEKIKLGIIGVGNMGTCHIETILERRKSRSLRRRIAGSRGGNGHAAHWGRMCLYSRKARA